jgi:hypothetical protein
MGNTRFITWSHVGKRAFRNATNANICNGESESSFDNLSLLVNHGVENSVRAKLGTIT